VTCCAVVVPKVASMSALRSVAATARMRPLNRVASGGQSCRVVTAPPFSHHQGSRTVEFFQLAYQLGRGAGPPIPVDHESRNCGRDAVLVDDGLVDPRRVRCKSFRDIALSSKRAFARVSPYFEMRHPRRAA